MNNSRSLLAAAGLLALSCVSALAQQTSGVPGSPGATTTLDGKQLPPPGACCPDTAAAQIGIILLIDAVDGRHVACQRFA